MRSASVVVLYGVGMLCLGYGLALFLLGVTGKISSDVLPVATCVFCASTVMLLASAVLGRRA